MSNPASNLSACRVCGQPVSQEAKTCPHCGAPDPIHSNLGVQVSKAAGKAVKGIVGFIVIAGLLLWWIRHNHLAGPHLEEISSKQDVPLLGDPSLLETFRNNGTSGKVLLTVDQNGKKWKFMTYYDSNEQREVKLTLPGLKPGQYHIRMEPAELASESDRQGAVSP